MLPARTAARNTAPPAYDTVVLVLRVLAERIENGEPVPELGGLFAAA
jgi:hypothetical protein